MGWWAEELLAGHDLRHPPLYLTHTKLFWYPCEHLLVGHQVEALGSAFFGAGAAVFFTFIFAFIARP